MTSRYGVARDKRRARSQGHTEISPAKTYKCQKEKSSSHSAHNCNEEIMTCTLRAIYYNHYSQFLTFKPTNHRPSHCTVSVLQSYAGWWSVLASNLSRIFHESKNSRWHTFQSLVGCTVPYTTTDRRHYEK
jgi:hypothetical protein